MERSTATPLHVSFIPNYFCGIANPIRRTYGSQEGEEIREGFEPTDDPPIIDPKVPDNENTNPNDQFVVGDDDDTTSPGAEERVQWQQTREDIPKLAPKYGLPEEEGFENVWGNASEHPHGEPKENP